jgi:hypothetical protein
MPDASLDSEPPPDLTSQLFATKSRWLWARFVEYEQEAELALIEKPMPVDETSIHELPRKFSAHDEPAKAGVAPL